MLNRLIFFFLLFYPSNSFSFQADKNLSIEFNKNQYELKCIEEGISTYLKFDGNAYSVRTRIDSKFSVGKNRSDWKNYFIANKENMEKIKNEWKPKDKYSYLQNLNKTIFAKIYKNKMLNLNTKNQIDIVGVKEENRNGMITRMLNQSVFFEFKNFLNVDGRVFVNGNIKGKVKLRIFMDEIGKQFYPMMKHMDEIQYLYVDLKAKLHLNTAVFTELDGVLTVKKENGAVVGDKQNYAHCIINGPREIPKILKNKPKILKIVGLVDGYKDSIYFEKLISNKNKIRKNSNALALVIGIERYETGIGKAVYAENDSKVFRKFAANNLGVIEKNIKYLSGSNADEKAILLSVKKWLRRAIKKEKTDIYIFFAGHGLASDDGKDLFLLPFDGSPELLEETSISRSKLFRDISSENPRSVTVFLDTCYSGTTRGTDMLIASRPIAIRALEQSIPNNFTVFSAAAGDQTSKPLEEAKHGMFSYFLMKGMEGDADSNNDNKITARELHAYVEQNVVQQSSGSQTPELQGDKDRVLVQFN